MVKPGKGQITFDTLYNYQQAPELPYSIQQDTNSGFVYITASHISYLRQDIEFTKLSKNGSILIQKAFGYPNIQLYVGVDGSLKKTLDGGWVFGGGVQDCNTSPCIDHGLLIKYDSNGDTVFTKTFGDSTQYIIYDCYATHDSGFVLVGYRAYYFNTTVYDWSFLVIKTDKAGNLQWEKQLGDSLKLDLGVSVIENEKNQIVASGWQLRQWPNFFPAIYVLDSLGNVLKTKYFNGPNDSGGAIINKYKKGKYIIQASLDTIISQGDDSAPVYIALLDSNYNFIWRTIYHRIEILGVYNIDTTHDGGIIMCGSISAPPSPQLGWFAKVDSMGNKLWEHIYQHTGPNTYQNFFGDARETYDHGFILSGMNYDFFLHTQDSWIVKLDSNGCLAQGCGINTDVVEIHPDWPIQVFPNPAHDQVRIDLRNGKGTLEIFDAFGRLVHTQMVVDQPLMDLDINSYSAGLYIIRYSTNSGVNTMRLVKQ